MLESLIDFIFDLFTLKTRKRGPLKALAEVQGDRLRLTLENQGKGKLEFAAVQGRDGNQRRHFPKVDLEVRAVLAPHQVVTATLMISELRAMDCRDLAILDTTGHAWPVEGFDVNALG